MIREPATTGNHSKVGVRYSHYKWRAKSKGLAFELTLEEFSSMENQPCVYCGELEIRNGVDRVDSSQGYILGNCVSCCRECNYMKSDLSTMRFLSRIEKIYAHQNKENPQCAD